MVRGMTEFEVYSRTRAANSTEAAVTLTAYGILALNKQAWEILGKPEAIVLLYARTERVIGIRPAAQGEDGAYPCRANGRHSKAISASAFFRYMSIPIGKTAAERGVSYRLPLVMQDGIGTVDLKQQGTPVNRKDNLRRAQRRDIPVLP